MKQTRLILFLVLLLVPVSAYAQRDPPTSEIELKSALLGDAQVQEILGLAAERLRSQEPSLKNATQ